jgi:peptide-methionine (S)-S-oxide reductase
MCCYILSPASGIGKSLTGLLLAAIFLMLMGGATASAAETDAPDSAGGSPDAEPKVLETATFGAGCFWCTEAVFQRLKGVQSVMSGYSGGHVKNPTYQQVCSGMTGHAEAIQVTFDPRRISYTELLEVFWKTHDPTTLNRQGPDVGTQYRSVIFYHSDEQRTLAQKYRGELDAAKAFRGPIVTEIVPFREFYRAEDYHQDYYNLHRQLPYCAKVVRPKLEKLERVFRDKLQDPAPLPKSADKR